MNQTKSISLSTILAEALLVTGNLIGAGLLGLPVKTGLAGFFPALIIMLIIGLGMFFSAAVLAREACKRNDHSFNFPSLYQHYLGPIGKWIAVFTNLLIIYGLLTAYLTGATTIISNLFSTPIPKYVILICFFTIVTGITITSVRLLRKYNILIMALVWMSFAFVVLLACKHVQFTNLTHKNIIFFPAAVPIIATSLHFHNIIPQVCHSLKNNFSCILKTILFGMCLSTIMNAIWLFACIGSLPLNDSKVGIKTAFLNNLPATVPLAKIINSPLFLIMSLLFSILVIIPPYLANGLANQGFIKDLTKNYFKKSNNTLILILSFGPPLLVSLFFPDIFLKALNIVGGIGIITLFGILPSVIAFMQKQSLKLRIIALFFLMLFTICLLFEIAQEFGLLEINPEIEYWKVKFINK